MVLQVLDLVANTAASEPFYGDCPTSYTNLDVNTTAQPTCTVIPQGKVELNLNENVTDHFATIFRYKFEKRS